MPKSLSLALYLATRARRLVPRNLFYANDKSNVARFGEAPEDRPKGRLVWFHTGQDSTGLAVRELAHRLHAERDDLAFLLTTSAESASSSNAYLISQRVPDDSRVAVRRFLDHWSPDVAVWTEPELRPALITETADRRIPLYLADAHTAQPDLGKWRWRRGMSAALLARFRKVLTGDGATAATLRRLGTPPETLEIAGYLEEGTAAMHCDEKERDALARVLSARPVWLATGITEAERSAVIAAQVQAQKRAHRLLLILSPDDPAKGAAWAKALSESGLPVALRSLGEEPADNTQIFLVDTEGEAGLWYRLAPISFLGRSLDSGGGVNPFEAAALGSAVIHGPNVGRHRQAYSRLASAGASRLVRNGGDLGEMVELLLSPDVTASMAHEAWKVCSSGAEVTDRIRDLIFAALDAAEA